MRCIAANFLLSFQHVSQDSCQSSMTSATTSFLNISQTRNSATRYDISNVTNRPTNEADFDCFNLRKVEIATALSVCVGVIQVRRVFSYYCVSNKRYFVCFRPQCICYTLVLSQCFCRRACFLDSCAARLIWSSLHKYQNSSGLH